MTSFHEVCANVTKTNHKAELPSIPESHPDYVGTCYQNCDWSVLPLRPSWSPQVNFNPVIFRKILYMQKYKLYRVESFTHTNRNSITITGPREKIESLKPRLKGT